jgi:hypothetical protein
MHDPLTWLHHNRTWLPLALSLLSLGASALTLWWTIHRDATLKPRLGVSLHCDRATTTWDASGKPACLMALSVINPGPGPVKCEYAVVRTGPAWRGLFGRSAWRVLLEPWDSFYSGELPAVIEGTARLELVFPESLLDQNPYQIGVRDSYGRFHWAPKRDIPGARADCDVLKRRFSEPPDGSPGG